MGAGGSDRPSRDAAAGPARAARRQVKCARAPAGGAALRPVPSAAPSVHVCASTARGADSVVAQRPGVGGSRDSAPGVLRGTARRDRRSGSRALRPDVPNDLPRPNVRFPETETGLRLPIASRREVQTNPPPGDPLRPPERPPRGAVRRGPALRSGSPARSRCERRPRGGRSGEAASRAVPAASHLGKGDTAGTVAGPEATGRGRSGRWARGARVSGGRGRNDASATRRAPHPGNPPLGFATNLKLKKNKS